MGPRIARVKQLSELAPTGEGFEQVIPHKGIAMFRKPLIAAAILIPASALAAPPAAFLRDAIQGNFSEVTLGQMIQHQGSSQQVRSFGGMLVGDHSKALQQAQEIASRMHVRIPATLTPQASREQRLLRHLRGPAFDREVRRYMIADHMKDIAKFSAQIRGGDRTTAGYAAATVPVMQHHLAMARALRA